MKKYIQLFIAVFLVVIFEAAWNQAKFEIQYIDQERDYVIENIDFKLYTQDIVINSKQYKTTAENIKRYFANQDTELYKKLKVCAKENSDLLVSEKPICIENRIYLECMRNDANLISFRRYGSFWRGTGTIETNIWGEGVTYDSKTGEKLEITDIVLDMDAFYEAAEAYVAIKLYEQERKEYVHRGESDLYERYRKDSFFNEMESGKWYLTDRGIGMMLWPEEKDGTVVFGKDVLIPYEEVIDYLNPKVLGNIHKKLIEIEKTKRIYDCYIGMPMEECEKKLFQKGFREEPTFFEKNKILKNDEENKTIILYGYTCERLPCNRQNTEKIYSYVVEMKEYAGVSENTRLDLIKSKNVR